MGRISFDDSHGAVIMALTRRDVFIDKEQVDELVELVQDVQTREEFERVVDEYCAKIGEPS